MDNNRKIEQQVSEVDQRGNGWTISVLLVLDVDVWAEAQLIARGQKPMKKRISSRTIDTVRRWTN